MTKLVAVPLDDGTIIYMEANSDVEKPATALNFGLADGETDDDAEPPEQIRQGSKGVTEQLIKRYQAMQGTIRTYTRTTLNAFKGMHDVDVDKVTLEFGLKVGGEAGFPYVTQGSTECNLKITVECSFPDKSDSN